MVELFFRIGETMNIEQVLDCVQKSETDNTNDLMVLADILEELEYPETEGFRRAIKSLAEAHHYWDLRKTVDDFQVEIGNWLATRSKG